MFKPESFTDMETAQEIMGKNFFGPNEATEHLGSVVSKEHYAMLMFTPFSKAELQECASTHHLVAILPMSILDMWTLHPEIFRTEDWQSGSPQSFSAWDQTQYRALYESKGSIGWKLMRTKPLDSNTDEELPTTPNVIVYTMACHFLATGEHLFETVYRSCIAIDTKAENKIGIQKMGGPMGSNYLCWYRKPKID